MVVVKKYKNPTSKPYTCSCPRCKRLLFCSSDEERVIKLGKNYIFCSYCKTRIVIKEWSLLLRRNKINKIINGR